MEGREYKEQRHFGGVGVYKATPGQSPDIFRMSTEGVDAIVIISFATGTVPQVLAPAIRDRVEAGVPVFLLSDNAGDKHGILKIAYGVQAVIAEAGAISLEKVNINNLEEVVAAIDQELSQGYKGKELGEIINKKYKYGADEQKPLAEWETPEGIKGQQERLAALTKKMNENADRSEEEA
jgi:hypothetical protein